MIKRITKLHKVGIFQNYISNAGKTADFKKYNAVYGWNGSGKTTLSRIFSVLQTGSLGELSFDDDFVASISTSNGPVSISKDSLPAPNPHVQVFNEDFIHANLDWTRYKARPILVIGEEKIQQKDSLAEIRSAKQKAQQEINRIDAAIAIFDKEKTRILEKARDGVLAELASYDHIKPKGGRASIYRNYTVIDVSNLLSVTDLVLPFLTDEEKVIRKDSLNEREEKEKLNDYATSLVWIDNFLERSAAISETSLTQIAGSSLEAEVGNDDQLREWLREGHTLHKRDASPDACKFCRNPLSTARLEDLDKYFDEALRGLLAQIDSALEILDASSIPVPESGEKFYKEFEREYATAKDLFFIEKINVEERIESIRTALLRRKKNPFERVEMDLDSLKRSKENLIETIAGINGIIAKHNEKTDQFAIKRTEAAHELELFIVCQHKADFLDVSASLEQHRQDRNSFNELFQSCLSREREVEEALRDHKTGAVEFNKLLKAFLGREEITFAAVDGGYAISRGNKPAKHLSEGERNAIALIFFLMKLKEDGIDPESLIVVIDDPVSSFDSQHTYQAYGFIKAEIKELNPQQFFLLTHNFHFFRQFRTWFGHERTRDAGFYILKCKDSKEYGRHSVIEDIDRLLVKHNSEYTFLFKLIYDRANAVDDPPLEDDYVSPNNLRKLLENYLSIKVPYGAMDIHGKFVKLLDDYPEYTIGAAAKGRIEAYCQDNSHPLYQDSINDFDEVLLGELKSACSDVIELIENTDPKHFKHLRDQVEAAA